MKKIILLISFIFLFSGCATIAHKDIDLTIEGLGVDVKYNSTIPMDYQDIPKFIEAINKFEILLEKLNELGRDTNCNY